MDTPTTQTSHIFISYEHKDQAYTRKLRDSLRQRGFEVWMDEHLESGDRWLRTIEQAVRDSAAVVVVMTPEARDSEWVEAEILLAQDEGKPIFPLLLRGEVFFLLVTKQYTNVTNGRMPPDDFYERLEREIRAQSKEEIIEAPEPARVREKRVWGWRRLRVPLAVVGLLAIVLLVGVVVSGLIGGGGEPTSIPKTQPPSSASLHDTWTRAADGMDMVYVPGGTFEMGSTEGEISAAFEQCEQDYGSDECQRSWYGDEGPRHSVTLDGFWIDRTEVTNAQYAGCVADGTCAPPSESGSQTRNSYYGASQFDEYPVIWIDWHDADTYCQWAGGRLPTEAEWEYAARGPDGNIYPWGSDPLNGGLLNYNGNLGDTLEVGSYPDGASWVGAVDVAGNVWEWVDDWYDSDYYARSPSHNPKGPETGAWKVLRGGSWYNSGSYVRAVYRLVNTPSYREDVIGFRCVVESGS